jgi:hypothetical protein
MIKPIWGEKILSGEKTLEIRGSHCIKHLGERVGLCFSGTSAIYGFVDIVKSVGPLSKSEWCALQREHCVPGEDLPYGKRTCAWSVANPERLETPIEIARSRGAVGWQSVNLNLAEM